MRITPQSEAAVMEANLLPAGEYPFTVRVAQETISKVKPDGSGGNPMIALQLEVYDDDGKGRRVNDYLMESVAYKLRHFAYAVGLGSQYERGELHASDMQGLSGRCLIKIEPAREQYNARNGVKDYCKVDVASAAGTPAPAPVPAVAPSSDEPPF
jgi:hypothetical protein